MDVDIDKVWQGIEGKLDKKNTKTFGIPSNDKKEVIEFAGKIGCSGQTIVNRMELLLLSVKVQNIK